MTLQNLLCFREVARTLNFTKAADNLYVSQSSLSHSIIALERELGTMLFIRKNGKCTALTRLGEQLMPCVERIFENIDAIESLSKEMLNPLTGVVVVAYSFINGHSLIPDVFSDFLKDPRHEGLIVAFDVTHNSRPTEERIVAGEVDLAFNCTPEYKGVATVPFAKQPLFCFLPSEHPLAAAESLTIPDLKDEMLINYRPKSELNQRISRMFQNHGLRINEIACYNDWSVQMSMVSLGMGIAISPMLNVDRKRICVVPLEDELAVRTVYMLYSAERTMSAAVNYVKNYCLEYSRSHMLMGENRRGLSENDL